MATEGQSDERSFWKQAKVIALVCAFVALGVAQILMGLLEAQATAAANAAASERQKVDGGYIVGTIPSGINAVFTPAGAGAAIGLGKTPVLFRTARAEDQKEEGIIRFTGSGFHGDLPVEAGKWKNLDGPIALQEDVPFVSSLIHRWPLLGLALIPGVALALLFFNQRRREQIAHEALPEVFCVGEGGRIGGYRLEKLLGQGAMAEVFSGRSVDGKGPEVAVKVLSEAVSANDEFRGRYQREAAITMQLRHPGIVAVEASGEEGGHLFLVMEKVDGGSLRDRIKPGGVPVAEAVGWTAAVLDALAYAHDQGIVHRDLKPENIMLTAAGAVKVADFGLARGAAYPTLTALDTTLGTPAYMPPEQVTGSRSTGQADQYAMGCVLYELLTGVPPFTDEDPLMLVFQHMNDDPPSPRELRADLSPALEAAVMKMLAKDPDERFSSADEAAAALREALQA